MGLMFVQLGLWVVNSAKYWKKTTFVRFFFAFCILGFHAIIVQVGFDLVDVQIPLRILDEDVASRIEWVYGNMSVSEIIYLKPTLMFTQFNGTAPI